MLSNMQREQLEPDGTALVAAIIACEKSEQWQQVVSLLWQMGQRQLRPTASSINAAISACEAGK